MKTLLISVILLFLFACSEKEKPLLTVKDFQQKYKNLTEQDLMEKETGLLIKDIKEIIIDNSYFKEEKSVNIIDTMFIIPLETTDECLISTIGKVIFQENLFYVFDKDMRNLFIFQDNGSLKYKVGMVGRGPEEYENIKDFCISKQNNIFLLDNDQNTILVYDNNASFKKKIKLNQYYNRIAYSQDHLILSTEKFSPQSTLKSNRLIYMDQNGNIITYLFPYSTKEENAPWGGSDLGIDITNHQHIIHYPYFSNHVYILNNEGKIVDSFIYKAENYEMPSYLTLSLRKKETFSEAFQKKRKYSRSEINDVIELDNYIYAELSVPPCLVTTFYNKNTKSVEAINSLFVKRETWQDLFGGMFTFVGAMPRDILIASGDISGLKIAQDIAHKENINLGQYDQMISNMQDDDNPCLLLIKIKTE